MLTLIKATFPVPYSAGLLKAIGVENVKEMESTMLQTAGDAAKIELVADLNEMKANGQDLIFLTWYISLVADYKGAKVKLFFIRCHSSQKWTIILAVNALEGLTYFCL